MEAFIIYICCLLGGVYTSYKSGFKKGSICTLDYLEEQGMIEFTDE